MWLKKKNNPTQEGVGDRCPRANCLAQKEAENNENIISTREKVLGIIVIALVIILVLVVLFTTKAGNNLRAAVTKRLVCCKNKGKGRGGRRGGHVGNIGPVRNAHIINHI